MKSLIKGCINKIIELLGIKRTRDSEVDKLKEQFSIFYMSTLFEFNLDEPNSLTGVVFSKDRALQLHALLCSYFEKVYDPADLYVIYSSSSEKHSSAYEELIKNFKYKPVIFIKQSECGTFKEELLNIVNIIKTAKIFFLVDDLLFIEPTELKLLSTYPSKSYVPSLRMGLNLTYCYTMQSEQPLPLFDTLGDGNLFCWEWQSGKLDWNYPLSVDGHIFSLKEIKSILKVIDFKAPNSLEGEMQQLRFLFLKRKGLAYKKSRIINLPLNKVQLENDNLFGTIHQDQLLQIWQKGLQLDYGRLYGFENTSAHQELEIVFMPRK